MQVQPTAVMVLDVAPHNTFSIVCTATVPANVTSAKQFVWRTGSTNLTAGAGVTINTINLNSPTSTSVLTTNASAPGTLAYSCDVTVLTSQSSATATVTVNGNDSYSAPHERQCHYFSINSIIIIISFVFIRS